MKSDQELFVQKIKLGPILEYNIVNIQLINKNVSTGKIGQFDTLSFFVQTPKN
jgi:hypothetical protein